MNLNKWLRTKIYRSVDPKKVQMVVDLSDEVSTEARRLRRRVQRPEAVEVLATAVAPRRNGNGHT